MLRPHFYLKARASARRSVDARRPRGSRIRSQVEQQRGWRVAPPAVLRPRGSPVRKPRPSSARIANVPRRTSRRDGSRRPDDSERELQRGGARTRDIKGAARGCAKAWKTTMSISGAERPEEKGERGRENRREFAAIQSTDPITKPIIPTPR